MSYFVFFIKKIHESKYGYPFHIFIKSIMSEKWETCLLHYIIAIMILKINLVEILTKLILEDPKWFGYMKLKPFFLFRNVLQHRTLSGTLIAVVKIIRLKKNLFSLPLLLEREDLYSMGTTTRERSLVFVLLVSSPI